MTDQTIAVTGAGGQVGRFLLDRLEGLRVRTIATMRTPIALPGIQVVHGSLDSADVQTALKEADIIVHLAGALKPLGKNSYEAANLGTTHAVARAARAGKASRILYLSYVGAKENSTNAYLRMKATAERILAETGREVVVFRCTHIVGSPDTPGPTASAMLAKLGQAVHVLGPGSQIIAPIYRDNVVSALLRAMQSGAPGVYDLTGPDRMTMDEMVRMINRNAAVRITHIPAWAARLLGLVVPALPYAMVDVLLRDSVGESSAAIHVFGLMPTSLKTVWV